MDKEPIQTPPTIASAESVSPQPALPPRSFNPFLILVVIVLMVLAGVGGLILGKSLNNSQPSTLPTVAPTPDLTVYTEATRSANWKTFTNKNKYTIKHPQTLKVFPEQYQEIEDPENADGISIQEENEGYNKPLLKIYVVDPTVTSYKFSSLKELAETNYKTNIENKGTFIRVINNLRESEFMGEKSYEYSIESKGFFGGWTGFLGEQGIIKTVVFTHNNKYFLIGYYDEPVFDQILSTFKFLD